MIRKLLNSKISIAVSKLHINICNNFQALWQNSEKWLSDSSYLSVRPSVLPSAWNTSVLTAWIWYLSIFPKSVQKIQVSLKSVKSNGTLHKDLCTFIIISHSFLHVSHKSCRENQNTFYVQWLIFESRSIYETMWKNILKTRQATDDNIIWDMLFACWVNKAPDTQSESVILLCFPTTKMVTRKRPSVTFIRTFRVLFHLVYI